MGILRADVVSHSQLEPTGGSIYLDGTGDYLSIASADAFAFGTGAFTFECWVNRPSLSAATQICGSSNDNFNLYMNTNGTISLWNGSANITTTNTIDDDTWTHVAICRVGTGNGQMRVFIDGVQGVNGTNATTYAAGNLLIGRNSNSGSTYGKGYISNVRVTGTAVYKQNFTVPKFELENIPGTILLCCRSSSSATASDVTYAAITSNGDTTASAVAPDVKKDIIDTGVVIGDNTKFDTLSYMVPPGGTTAQSNRGRAIFSGGYSSPTSPAGYKTTIDYVQIQSLGNAVLFGNLSALGLGEGSACASSTRAIHGGGGPSGSVSNIMEYVTIASASNTTDFGDLVVARRSLTALANNTRGIWAGGATPAMREEIDYATIATVGNATDFGNLTDPRRNPAVGSITSTTRGIFAGGNPGTGPNLSDTIDYITIASAGNATDFGNQATAMREQAGASSSVRGLFAGGYTSPANLNRIEYITIATTGNGTDFGDLNITVSGPSGTSNGTRALFAGGSNPYINSMEYVTIATTGNAKDFGDLTVVRMLYSGTSDSHGGIS